MNRIRSIGRLGLLAAWAVAAATLSSAPAAITVQDGVPWVYEIGGDGGATILHGPGCGDVTIPAQLDCYPVTSIGANAFSRCTGLTSMTLPGSLTYIGYSAFSGCTGLATLCVPVGLAGTTQVAESGVPSSCTVLYGDAWEKVDGAAWSYVVHDGMATVTAGPREGAITIPSVLGGHPVTGIGSKAFYQCRGLTGVTIGDSVTSIGDGAFYNCSGLTSVTIPDSVTSIGSTAFYNCNGLTAVHIHDLAAWCGIEFGDLSANPLYYAHHLYLGGEEVAGALVIPNGVANIGMGAFCSCTNLTSVTIPDSVTSIGDYAFRECSGLTSVTIPDSVTSIGNGAFESCRGLTNMTVGGSVTNIGRGMVTNCSYLATMNVPEAWRSLYVYDSWTGSDVFWRRYAGVPSGCAIVYYEPAASAVTATGVPHEWLEEKAGEALAAAGGDYEAAAKAAAANGRAVWECYVAGLDPGDAEKDFTTEISFADGVPEVSWTPDLNEGGTKSARSYVVEGKSAMEDEWDATNSASRFFRVKVELPKP